MNKYFAPISLLSMLLLSSPSALSSEIELSVENKTAMSTKSSTPFNRYPSDDIEINNELTKNFIINFENVGVTLSIYNYYFQESLSEKDLIKVDLEKIADDIVGYFETTFPHYNIYNSRKQVFMGLIGSTIIEHPDQFDEVLSRYKDRLSFSEKIIMTREFGEQLNQIYNSDRALESDFIRIPIQQQLQALKEDNPQLAGICGDVALLQTALLKSLGVEKTYIIGYKSFSTGEASSKHAKIVALNPQDERQVMSVNYGQVEVQDAVKGTDAITSTQSLSDTGSSATIYDSQGTLLTIQDNDLGKMLKRVTGQKLSFEEDTSTYNTITIGATINGLRLKYLSGKTSNNENVKSAGISKSLQKTFSGLQISSDVSAAYSSTTRYSSYQKQDKAHNFVYLHGTLRASLIPSFIPVSLYIEKEGSLMYGKASYETGKEYEQSSTESKINTGIDLRVQFNDQALLRTYLEVQSQLARTELYMGEGPKYMILKKSYGVEGSFSFDQIEVNSRLEYIQRSNFSSINGAISIKNDRYNLMLEANKPLSNAPLFFDGAQEKYKFKLNYNYTKSLRITTGLSYNKDIDDINYEMEMSYKLN